MNTCAFFGIYPDAIESASEACDRAMKQYGIDISEIDDTYDFALQRLRDGETDYRATVTDQIIFAMFMETDVTLKNKRPDLNINWYVNCYDSHLIINGEEV